jgi:creatinine amidohydrolase
MLHLHSDLVAMEHAENFVPKSVELATRNSILTPEGAVGFGWQTQDLQEAGACGNARAAKAELGAEVVARAARRLYALIEEVIEYPLAGVTQMTRYGQL